MHQNVARCRDGDVSRVSLKYDATECSPGLLSMECYPSLMVPGRRRMFTSVGEHGMVATPPCSWSFSTTWFSMQAHVFFRDTWHYPYITSCFLENVFTPLVSLFFLECKLHCGTCSLALKARELYCICPLMLCIIFSCVYCHYYVNLSC